MTDLEDAEWLAFRAQLREGQIVEGHVAKHAPFGVFVDLGSARFLGVVLLSNLPTGPPETRNLVWPALRTSVRCVVLGFGNLDRRQPRLSMRPAHLQAAEHVAQVAGLAPVDREAFLHHALDDSPEVAAAAIWRVHLLPLETREGFLRELVQYSDAQLAARAVRQIKDLPPNQRADLFRLAVQHPAPEVARSALWEVDCLSVQEHKAFLQQATHHSDRDVAARAIWQLERFSR